MATGTPPSDHSHGADLARVALAAARKSARRNGGASESRTPQHRSRPARRALDGRDPKGFGDVLDALITDRAWRTPVAGGKSVDLWPSIAGSRLAKHVPAAYFDESRRELVVRSESPAWLTQLRLVKPTLLERYRDALGPDAVLDIVRGSSEASAAASAPSNSPVPAPTGATAAEAGAGPRTTGYQRTIAAHRRVQEAAAPQPAPEPRRTTPFREPVEEFARELLRRQSPSRISGRRLRELAEAMGHMPTRSGHEADPDS
ncbi:DciA family protein [Streptomyces anulatus]